MRKKFSGVLFVLFFTRKKRYQKKRASVPLDRFANYVRKTIYSGVCSPPITGFPEKRTRFLGVPYNVAAPRLWFLNFALQNSPSERRKGGVYIKPWHALRGSANIVALLCADGDEKMAPLCKGSWREAPEGLSYGRSVGFPRTNNVNAWGFRKPSPDGEGVAAGDG